MMNGAHENRHTLAVHLWQALRWFDDGLQISLRREGIFSTTRSQSLAIGHISLGENRPSRLARSIGVSPQAMSQILRELADVGLVSSAIDAQDGRARFVQLTNKGEAYLDTVRPIFFRMEAELDERFGKPVMDVVRMVLGQHWDPPISVLEQDKNTQAAAY